MNTLPNTGYLRLPQIIGDKKVDPPVPAIIPVCSSSWWAGIKKGVYPEPVKLGPNTTAWKVEDIRALIQKINEKNDSIDYPSDSGNTKQTTVTLPINFLASLHDQLTEGAIRDAIGQLLFGEELSPETKTALHYEGINPNLIVVHDTRNEL